jgi:DNA-binding phage protein
MAKKSKRIFRKTTPAERQRIIDLQEALDQELPMIKMRGHLIRHEWKKALEAISKLRTERERRGMSLADVQKKANIGRSALCKLENSPEPNPTVRTLLRYADAIGMELDIELKPKPQAVP